MGTVDRTNRKGKRHDKHRHLGIYNYSALLGMQPPGCMYSLLVGETGEDE